VKRYDKVFSEQALKLSDKVGLKKAAEQLGIVYGTLADWRKQRTKMSSNTKAGSPNPEDEIARLKKANSELQKANSILKDALGFFVDDRKR